MGSSSFYNGNAADYATLDPSTVTASAAAAAASAVAAQASATSASTSLSTLVSTLASYVTSTALTTILSGYATGGSLAAYAPLASPALTGTPTAPTAPLGTNNTQIATTAFVLANSAPPGREKLTGNRTYYVRPDGSNSNTGLVDSAAGAFLTWNAAYIAVASKIDFAGFTVTISGGASAATFSAGLLIDFAWTGGGSLIIDLRGSSISETVTKGILINEVLPGLVTIQNSAGLGVGGVISSAGFAGVQVSAATKVNIGVGIGFGACFDSPLEATQGGTLSLTSPINVGVAGTGSNALALTALGGIIGFNGQTVNFLSNQTYSKGTLVAQYGGIILADNVTWATGGHAVSGPRYYRDPTSFIYTALASSTYIPGSSGGVFAGYDNTTLSAFITGGSAPGSTLTIRSTDNASPSGDSLTFASTSLFFSANSGTSNVFFGTAGFSGALVSYAGSSTGATILKASSVASGTLTLPPLTGTLAVSGFFSASLSANQSVSSGVSTKIACGTELSDVNNWYDNATNFRFTPQLAGKWLVNAQLSANGTTVTEIDATLKLNGSSYAEAFSLVGGSVSAGYAGISKVINFNGTTDYVEFFGALYGTGTLNVLGGSGPIRTFFEATYLGQ